MPSVANSPKILRIECVGVIISRDAVAAGCHVFEKNKENTLNYSGYTKVLCRPIYHNVNHFENSSSERINEM